MNEEQESGGFRRRIYWYVLTTAVVQFSLGVLIEITSGWREPISSPFLLLLANLGLLLLYPVITYTLLPIAIVVGTFIMFLMIVSIGEYRRILEMRIQSHPLEESRRSANHD